MGAPRSGGPLCICTLCTFLRPLLSLTLLFLHAVAKSTFPQFHTEMSGSVTVSHTQVRESIAPKPASQE